MNPYVYNVSLLSGIGLVSGGAWLVSPALSLASGGALIILMTLLNVRLAGGVR